MPEVLPDIIVVLRYRYVLADFLITTSLFLRQRRATCFQITQPVAIIGVNTVVGFTVEVIVFTVYFDGFAQVAA